MHCRSSEAQLLAFLWSVLVSWVLQRGLVIVGQPFDKTCSHGPCFWRIGRRRDRHVCELAMHLLDADRHGGYRARFVPPFRAYYTAEGVRGA